MIWIGDNDTNSHESGNAQILKRTQNASIWTDLNITDDTITPLVPSHRHVRIEDHSLAEHL